MKEIKGNPSFKEIMDDEKLFESIIEDLYEETVYNKSGNYYIDEGKTIKGKFKNIGKKIGKHKKLAIGTGVVALTGGAYLYGKNKGKKEGIKKGRREVLYTGIPRR
jgi:hypothetical protein